MTMSIAAVKKKEILPFSKVSKDQKEYFNKWNNPVKKGK